jgi:NADH:ubiquinone reductase (H+-translocating)
MELESEAGNRGKLVIVGAGFAGLSAAKALAKSPFEITIVDRHNYHLFQPLLYQVATAALSPADIASPIRSILRGQKNVSVILANVSGVDLEKKEVLAEDHHIAFDQLIIATGAQHAYFGHDEWERYAPGLKRIEDATYLRCRILVAFEKAEAEPDAARRRALLTFVVVGGGATGVEMAGAIAELAHKGLAGQFQSFDPRSARVVLIEAAERLLSGFDPSLSEAARASLASLGVEIRLGSSVTACDENGVTIGGERLEAATIVWAAGVKASPVGRWLAAPMDRSGRVLVEADFSVPGHPDIFVLGDAAFVRGADGNPLPGVAPVAKQQGVYLGKLLTARSKGRALPPFRYRDYGMLATIGRQRGLAQIGALKLSGFPAWLLWSVAHIYFLIGFRNRLSVALNWAWHYITYQSGTRLITGIAGSRLEDMVGPLAQSPPPTFANDKKTGGNK